MGENRTPAPIQDSCLFDIPLAFPRIPIISLRNESSLASVCLASKGVVYSWVRGGRGKPHKRLRDRSCGRENEGISKNDRGKLRQLAGGIVPDCHPAGSRCISGEGPHPPPHPTPRVIVPGAPAGVEKGCAQPGGCGGRAAPERRRRGLDHRGRGRGFAARPVF